MFTMRGNKDIITDIDAIYALALATVRRGTSGSVSEPSIDQSLKCIERSITKLMDNIDNSLVVQKRVSKAMQNLHNELLAIMNGVVKNTPAQDIPARWAAEVLERMLVIHILTSYAATAAVAKRIKNERFIRLYELMLAITAGGIMLGSYLS